ncbi:MAG: hypothetical protein PHZ04_03120 [Patescibacteria group bacterium]|nr:hypothetical protein [Patescibacteria group bacterium]MDD5294752.1 hypothetical protein [Patescibacteria group bacterium]MDD5554693.1 hypothetical protein [Patescibacteria group bacterium]
MKEIKRIKNLSLAKITAAIYGLVGFFVAIAVAIMTMANIIIREEASGSVLLITLFNFGIGILIGLATAVATAIIGWIIGFLGAAFYNMFAKRLGGIKFDLVESEETLRQAQGEDRKEGEQA